MIASSVACTVASYTGVIAFVAQHLARGDAALARRAVGGRREGDEQVARARAGDAAHPPDAERGAAGHAAKLVRQQRRVGADDDDDRVLVRWPRPAPAGQRSAALGGVEVRRLVALARLGDLLPHRHPRDAEQPPLAEVALHQHADREAAARGRRASGSPCRSRP